MVFFYNSKLSNVVHANPKIFFIFTLLRFANVPKTFFFHSFLVASQKSFNGSNLSSSSLSFSRSFTHKALAVRFCFFSRMPFSAFEMMPSEGHSLSGWRTQLWGLYALCSAVKSICNVSTKYFMTENLICGLNMKGEGRGKKFSGMMFFKKFFEGRGGTLRKNFFWWWCLNIFFSDPLGRIPHSHKKF